MMRINQVKKENAAVILADGFEIGTQAGGISYKELNGLLGGLFAGIRSHRTQWLLKNKDNSTLPIPGCDPAMLDTIIQTATNKARFQEASSEEESDEEDDSNAYLNSDGDEQEVIELD
jgi:hypothetical protein